MFDSMCEFYGTLGLTMFTLFKSISGGINWHEMITPLEDVGFYCVGLFVMFICFTIFAVLNVVTGVFCNSAIENANRDPALTGSSKSANT